MTVAYIRRLSPMWILIAPTIGGIAIAGCFMIAGQRADHAATSVKHPLQPPRHATEAKRALQAVQNSYAAWALAQSTLSTRQAPIRSRPL